MSKSNKGQYVAILVEDKGRFTVKLAKRLNTVNQFSRHWKRVSSRGLARKLNNGSIVIK